MNKILTYATVCAILIFPVVVKAQLKKTINLPAPVLKTNTGGVYTETSWDLDLMKFNFTRPADNPAPPGDVFNPQFSGAHSSSAPTIGEYTLQAKEDRSINTYGSDFEINGKGASTVWMFRQTKATDPRLYHPAL
ncbi:MAG TPA: hypothetical protein VK618_04815, partial [Flavitalea sp.]|nr:hypothetical protein [Flavitalea sp.]